MIEDPRRSIDRKLNAYVFTPIMSVLTVSFFSVLGFVVGGAVGFVFVFTLSSTMVVEFIRHSEPRPA